MTVENSGKMFSHLFHGVIGVPRHPKPNPTPIGACPRGKNVGKGNCSSYCLVAIGYGQKKIIFRKQKIENDFRNNFKILTSRQRCHQGSGTVSSTIPGPRTQVVQEEKVECQPLQGPC
jgi:hypothetical protein